jgi:pyridoxal phosphate enzyme (YggS family)
MEYRKLVEEVADEAIKAGRDPSRVQIVVVTKGRSWDQIQPFYDLGVRNFAESRLQDALPKIESAPKDIVWHYIGNLQKKKCEKVLAHFSWIHSVDSIELAEKIASNPQSHRCNLLLQVNASGEESKQGLSPQEWESNIDRLLKLPQLNIQGFMTMAPLTEDQEVVRSTFRKTKELLQRVNAAHNLEWNELSMGMSGDFRIAIQEGATRLRIGSLLF